MQVWQPVPHGEPHPTHHHGQGLGSLERGQADEAARHLQEAVRANDDAPRVALMFLVRGPMPLERVWREFFATAAEVSTACPGVLGLWGLGVDFRQGVAF